MKPVLVDSNVILDIATNDPRWFEWSQMKLAYLGDRAVLVINAIIFAEVSADYVTIEETDKILAPHIFRRDPIPYEAAFLAAKAFVKYRRRGGKRGSPLPDFIIGAHAAVAGYELLTRDASRYRTYFPTLKIIAP
jgi:predicted nucleic acid-binding protein